MQSRIEQQVMAGVGAIYIARALMGRIALECYALAASALALWQFTWVHKVMNNFSVVTHGGVSSIATYISYAFLHTHLPTQLALVVAAIAALALVVDAARALARPTYRLV